jgi:hypothetical protein
MAVFTDRGFKALELLEQSVSNEQWQKIPILQHPWF